jgi:hypothetical protein
MISQVIAIDHHLKPTSCRHVGHPRKRPLRNHSDFGAKAQITGHFGRAPFLFAGFNRWR